MIYHFSKPGQVSPDLTALKEAVLASAMTDKGIDFCRWDEEPDGDLEVVFTNELGAGDKLILDGIVAGV